MSDIGRCGCYPSHVFHQDLFLVPPERTLHVPIYPCATGCHRAACCHSTQGFANFCCQRCAETGGLKHHPGCDATWAGMVPYVITQDHSEPVADIPLIPLSAGPKVTSMIALGPFDPQTKTRDVAIVDVEKQEFRVVGDVVSWQEDGTEHWTARDSDGFYHHNGKYYSPDSGSALEAAVALCEHLSAGPKVTA